MQRPGEGIAVYEEVPKGTQFDIRRDHVVLHRDAKLKDYDAPQNSEAATKWNSLAARVPGMKPEMVELADLQGKAEYVIIEELNIVLAEKGFELVEHVSDVVNKLGGSFTPNAQKEALRAALTGVFEKLSGSNVEAQAAISQWPEVMRWRRRRVAFAHPLGFDVLDKVKFGKLKAQVPCKEAYASVRSAAKVLIAAAERVVQDQESEAA